MIIELLGTGSADRWPNPFCRCASCDWARQSGAIRDRTSVLIDSTLLIDPGPDAGGHGRDLAAVRTVLVTHDHPDHLDPALLLARTWASTRAEALLVAGPPQAIEHCRQWLAPDSPVELRELSSDDELVTESHRIRALPAMHSTSGGPGPDGTALLYEVSDDQSRLLYATDTAGLPHDQLRGCYDVVLLEETFGDQLAHGTAHLDLPSFAREVSRLRLDRRIAADGQVVAVHLSHHNGPDLASRLAPLGASALPDGSLIRTGPDAQGGKRTPPVMAGRTLLVTGGARSGKSRYAEAIAAGRPVVRYVATAPRYDDDEEWQRRLAAHRSRRPAHWEVVETLDLIGHVQRARAGELLLIDCLTLWLTGLLDSTGSWNDARSAHQHAQAGAAALADVLELTPADVVLVANEVGWGVVPEAESGRLFQDLLGTVTAVVAAACDDVVAVIAGQPLQLKGRPWT